MALRLLRGFERFGLYQRWGHISKRHFLSEAYSCQDVWNNRMQHPMLQKIKPYEFAVKLQESFDRNEKPTAVDLDLLANVVSELETIHLDFVQNIFYRFRHSAEAKNVLESMSHALIRNLLKFGEIERLMSILRDKIHYGIFLDDYTSNMLFDYFLKHKLYKEAAEIAVDLTLQEDLAEPIARTFALYASYLRLHEILENPEEPVVEEAEDDGELKYRRVGYIMLPFYDDHFDVPTEKQRIGKVLTMAVKLEDDSVLSRSYELIGWGFYEKFEKGLDLIRKWLESDISPAVNEKELETFGSLISNIQTKETPPPKEPGLLRLPDLYPFITAEQKTQYLQSFQDLSDQLKKSGKVTKDVSVENDLLTLLNKRIKQCEGAHIETQKALLAKWADERVSLLEGQIHNYQQEKKKRDIAERLLALKAKEEKLRYFEEKLKIDMKIIPTPKTQVLDEEVVEEEQFVLPPGERKDKKAR